MFCGMYMWEFKSMKKVLEERNNAMGVNVKPMKQQRKVNIWKQNYNIWNMMKFKQMVISATSIFWCKHFLLIRNILYSGVCFTLEHLAFLMPECSLHKFPFKFFLSSSYWWNSNGIFWTFNKYRQYFFLSVN